MTRLLIASLITLTFIASHTPATRAANPDPLICTLQRIGAGFQTWATVRLCEARTAVHHPSGGNPTSASAISPPAKSKKAPVSMLVTYYLATGSRMAGGKVPYVGAAACGYDLALGARIFVPGVGALVCEDRIGYLPWRHVDVFGVPLRSGYRTVTIY